MKVLVTDVIGHIGVVLIKPLLGKIFTVTELVYRNQNELNGSNVALIK